MKCVVPFCPREGKYRMGLRVKGEENKVWGLVCGVHEKSLGRKNLLNAGLTPEQVKKFEKESNDECV